MRYGYAFRKIPLTQGKYAIVDPEDYEELAKHKWFAKRCDRRYYAVRSGKNKNVKMHQVIMGTKEGKVIDHINGNGLDNRKGNVRFATAQQNGWNKRKQRGNYSSKYKGVHWEKKRKEWRARIKCSGRSMHLGRFETEEEAAEAYDTKARELFGEFAWLNFPAGPTVGRRKKRRNGIFCDLGRMLRLRLSMTTKRLRFAERIRLLANIFRSVYNDSEV